MATSTAPWIAVPACVVAIGTLTACTPETTVATPKPSPTSSPSLSERDQIVRAYTDYWPASVKAAKLPPDQARPILEPYVEPDHLQKELDGAAKLRKRGLEPWGYVVVYVQDVKISGSTATVIDCQDDSASALANQTTHARAVDAMGGRHIHLRTKLRRGKDGRWRIASGEQLEAPCTRQS